jgi:hypothetical protein
VIKYRFYLTKISRIKIKKSKTKKEAVKSLDFYNEESVSYKTEKMEIEAKLNQELEKSKILEEN